MKTYFNSISQAWTNGTGMLRFGLKYGPSGFKLYRCLKKYSGLADPVALRDWLKEVNVILSVIAAKTENTVDDKITMLIDTVILENKRVWDFVYAIVVRIKQDEISISEFETSYLDLEKITGKFTASDYITMIGGIISTLNLVESANK